MRDGTILLGGRGAAPALVRRDRTFAPLVRRHGPARVGRGEPVFATLVRAIVNQQLSQAAAASVYRRLRLRLGGRVTPARLAAVSTTDLRACGLSRPKAGYVQGLARAAQSGELPVRELRHMSDERVVEACTALDGIGEWTAHMLLIFTLHRPDVLPTADLGIRDAARIVYRLSERPDKATLEALAAPWRPYRSVASWYLWTERDRLVRQRAR